MKIYIIRYDPNSSSNKQYIYEAKNIGQYSQNMTIPVQAFGMPENDTTEALLTKAEGNTEKIQFSWIIKNEQYSPLLDSSYTPINSVTIGGNAYDPRTPDGAYRAFIHIFEKVGISSNEKYEFQLWDDDANQNLLQRFGIISMISVSKGAQDPATYNINIEFTVGTDVSVS